NDSGVGFTTNEGSSFVTTSVLMNDSDPNGDTLTIAGFDTTGTRGSVIHRGGGTFSYDPAGNFNGLTDGQNATDIFTYTVADPSGGTAKATVTITISGVGPINPTTSSDVATTPAGTPVTIDVTANDTGGASITSVSIGSQPSSGMVHISGLSITYTPNAGFDGQDTFTYVANSLGGQSSPTLVTVTVSKTLTFVPGSISQATDNPALLSTAAAFDDVCIALADTAMASQSRLFSICQGLAQDASQQQSIDNALLAIGTEEAFAASDSSFDFSDGINANLFGRLQAVRSGDRKRGVDLGSLRASDLTGPFTSMQAIAMDALGDGLSSLGGDNGPWGVFFSGTLGFGNRLAGASAGSRSFDTRALTAGVDYLMSDAVLLGLAVSFSNQDSQFDAQDSFHDVNGLSYSLYGSAELGPVHLEGHATYGTREHQLRRNISFQTNGNSVDELARADFSGKDLILGLRAAYPVALDDFDIDAKVGVTYIDGQIDGYQERGAGDLNLVVGEQSYDYLITDLGARFAYSFEKSDGAVLTPFLDLTYSLISGRDDRHISAGLVSDPLGRRDILLTSITENDSEYFDLTAGLSARIRGISISGEYSTTMGLAEVNLDRVSVTLSMPFGH
ncbi:autotransporter domain-containing protein, partial [Tsuneonella sp. HG249]